METDTKGDIVYIALTDINGNTILRDERNDSTLQNKLYTGHKYDNVTQLTYAHARYLDTRTHTFTSVDPLYYRLPTSYLTDPQQLNAYSYAGNNPVSNTDPTGLAKATGAIATFNQMMVNAPAGTHSSAASQKAFNSQVNATMNIIYGTSGGGGGNSLTVDPSTLKGVSQSGSSYKGSVYTAGGWTTFGTGFANMAFSTPGGSEWVTAGVETFTDGPCIRCVTGQGVFADTLYTGDMDIWSPSYIVGAGLGIGVGLFTGSTEAKGVNLAGKGLKNIVKSIVEHSYNKHIVQQAEADLSKGEFGNAVKSTILNPSEKAASSDGSRHLFWNNDTGMIVIVNDVKPTAFFPKKGYKYYLDQVSDINK